MSSIKISDIQVLPIRVPRRTTTSALGTFTYHDYGVVLIETDEGVTGLGEISTLWDGQGQVQCSLVEHHFKPLLLGEDPTAITRCMDKVSTLVENAGPARAAIDMALVDITGKYLDTPAYTLLGGMVRDRVPLSRSIHMGPSAQMADMASGLVRDGYKCVKVKVGAGREADLEAVAAVRHAIGSEPMLRIDANMGWSTAKDAIRNIKALEQYDLHSVEQPLPRARLEETRLVRWAVDTPIMLDESVWGPSEAWSALTCGAADILNIYVAESGGLTNAMLTSKMAQLAGTPCVVGAMPELGIGTAAAIHLAVSMPELYSPVDACGSLYHDLDIIREQFDVQDGQIAPPRGPGLGVTLDEEALRRVRTT